MGFKLVDELIIAHFGNLVWLDVFCIVLMSKEDNLTENKIKTATWQSQIVKGCPFNSFISYFGIITNPPRPRVYNHRSTKI